MQDKWEEFLGQYGYDKDISSIASIYPEKRSLYVKYADIEHFDIELADELLKSPTKVIKAGEAAIYQIAKMAQTIEEGAIIHLRIKEIPHDLRVGIRDIRSKHMSQFISVEGLVRKSNEVRPRVQNAAFKCLRCGHITTIFQEEAMIREPMECAKDEGGGGGCGRGAGATKFKLDKELSTFIDTEKIEIQEKPEGLEGGAQPQSLTAYVEDDIAGMIFPGARIVINGILDSRMRRKGSQGQTTFDIFVNVNCIEFMEADAFDIEVSDEEMADIEELAAEPNIIEMLRDSISPTISGNLFEKEALALQLFGGVPKKMPDGTAIRGDIHVLLVGDPGTAKSQLLRYMSNITPRGIYASGKSSTGAGLTAAAVKDDWSEGRWTLEAGALVLADKGLACIDELDKMSAQDRSSMHEAMEQQTISVAKAGINATLQSRCSLLGAANPKYGRFSEQAPIADQINLPPTLLSRFDLIFPLRDMPDPVKDAKMADHILRSHYVGELKVRFENEGDTDDDFDADAYAKIYDSWKPLISKDMLRKYVFVAKKRRFPVLTEEAIARLKEYYLEVRKIGETSESKSVPITPRQLEGFVRVAEASARARMDDEVNIDDAERAIRIVREYLSRVIGHGKDELSWDADSLYTGVPHSQQQKILSIRNIMKNLLKEDSQGFTINDVIREAEAIEIDEAKVRTIWDNMRRGGDFFEVGRRDGEALYRFAHEL